jgi:O-antigen biosynthesis protein
MGAGTPVVTSRVGGEGVFPVPHPSVVDAEAAFISTAVELYGNPSVWSRHQSLICEALDAFSPDLLVQSLATLERLFANLSEVRVKDYSGQAFWQQTLRSTEYFSRWITAKNQR